MLTTPPILAAPTDKEPMLLYIAATSRMVSTVIVVEHKGHDHIIIKRTKGNCTRPKNGMTGQDRGGKARLAGIALFL